MIDDNPQLSTYICFAADMYIESEGKQGTLTQPKSFADRFELSAELPLASPHFTTSPLSTTVAAHTHSRHKQSTRHDFMNASDGERLRAHVAQLEFELQTAKSLLRRAESQSKDAGPTTPAGTNGEIHDPSSAKTSPSYTSQPVSLPLNPSIHNLMLLSDSALPLGSFAYSSGLESFLAHHRALNPQGTSSSATPPLSLFHTFLRLSIHSVAATTIPYVLAAFRDPLSLMDLDNDLDASTPCTVARRASVSQGRALLSVWERALHTSSTPATTSDPDDETTLEASTCLQTFASDLKLASLSPPSPTTPNGHLPPLWGVVCAALSLTLEETAYLFLLNHVKAVLSAAVRASVMGPYMSHSILASREMRGWLRGELERSWWVQPEDAGQGVPVMDLWVGRHEVLYSRIFNS